MGSPDHWWIFDCDRQQRLLPAGKPPHAGCIPLVSPAWLCLAISVYEGFRVQEFYVAYLIAARAASAKSASIINQIAESIENATRYQIGSLEIALLCLAIWLGVYIVWWVRSNEPGGKGK